MKIQNHELPDLYFHNINLFLFNILFLLILVYGYGAAAQTGAGNLTGNQLLAICDSNNDACTAFVHGVIQTHAVLRGRNPNFSLYCSPAGVTSGQFVRLVVNYMRNNPQNTHEPAAALVLVASANAFPCRR